MSNWRSRRARPMASAVGLAALAALALGAAAPANGGPGIRPGPEAARGPDTAATGSGDVGTADLVARGDIDRAAQPPATPEDTARAVHLLSRATYGVRPEDLEEVLRIGREAWLERQLRPDRIDDSAAEARLQRYATATKGPAELFEAFPPPQVARALVLGIRPGDPQPARDQITPEQRQQLAAMNPNQIPLDLAAAKLVRAVHTERQLEEVMTDFWFNHFNVFVNKAEIRYLVADYEQNAIRANVFGKFEDMLVATARHPAMLIYLDNATSSASPDAPTLRAQPRARPLQQVRRPRAQRGGLNENYARELLELHTLGVDGGYTQQDVIEVARAFTGWTFQRPRPALRAADAPLARRAAAAAPEEFTFQFRPELHDAGEKTVLGHRLRAGRGMEDGLEVLRILARHPSTANFIARKLVTHFVADEPPEALVREIADVFNETGGDLREVTRALFTADAFYDAAHRRAKVKRPFEFVASALRVTNAEIADPRRIVQELRTFGHQPYGESAPTGYPTTHEDWVSASAMIARMNFALALAGGELPGVRIAPGALVGDVAPGPAPGAPVPAAPRTRRAGANRPSGAAGGVVAVDALLRRVLPGVDNGELREVIAADLAGLNAPRPRESVARALGLALGSPEFQRY